MQDFACRFTLAFIFGYSEPQVAGVTMRGARIEHNRENHELEVFEIFGCRGDRRLAALDWTLVNYEMRRRVSIQLEQLRRFRRRLERKQVRFNRHQNIIRNARGFAGIMRGMRRRIDNGELYTLVCRALERIL